MSGDEIVSARPGYSAGVVMFESLADVAIHCTGYTENGIDAMSDGARSALVMYDMRCVPFDDINACEDPENGIIDSKERLLALSLS